MADKNKIRQSIIKGEHTGSDQSMYEGNLYERKSNSSSAKGLYGYLDFWNPLIEKFAKEKGYKYENIDSFLKNSNLQNRFFDYYVDNYMNPEISRLKKQIEIPEEINQTDLQLLYHKYGMPQTKKIIQNNLYDEVISDISPNEYLRRSGAKEIKINEPLPEIIQQDYTYQTEQPDNTNTTSNLVPLELEMGGKYEDYDKSYGRALVNQDGGLIRLEL